MLYKTTGKIDRGYDVTEATFWDFKKYGDIDSLNIEDKKGFIEVLEKIPKKPLEKKPFLNPEYAIVIKTQRVIDTLYLNVALDEAYFITKPIMFDDKNGIFFSYFQEKRFITKHTEYLLD